MIVRGDGGSYRCLTVLLAPMVAAAALCSGVCASASALAPSGDFAVFSACPRFVTGVNLCLFASVDGGQVKIGKLTVPIEKAIVLRGGIAFDEVTEVETFVKAVGGETLSRTPLNVPGGLLGIVPRGSLTGVLDKSLDTAVSRGLTGVSATLELVGLPTIDKRNLVLEEGTAIALSVRVKLTNPFLGSECYVGSPAVPLTLNLTSGATNPPPPNLPIHGVVGEIDVRDNFEIVVVGGNVLVDNAFSSPRASGCGGSLSALLDPIIDAKIGLPSPPGHNGAILLTNIEEATTLGVIASEK